ncbi:spore germination protein [Neobacillus cucumis]|nr:spore germination protein [Neobacillus cucumis]
MFRKPKFKLRESKSQGEIELTSLNSLFELIKKSMNSDDFIHYCYPKFEHEYWISYNQSLVDPDILHKDIMCHLDKARGTSLENIKSVLPIENIMITSDVNIINAKIHTGYVVIQLHELDVTCLLVQAESKQSRAISLPEVEFSVVGPKESFVESMSINLNLIRKRLPIAELTVKQFEIGSVSKTNIAVIFIEGIANQENVNTVLQRVKEIDFDQIIDSSYITQMISDNHLSLFPQLVDTERPDRCAAVLSEGKVVVLVNGSPHALISPTSLIEFFAAFEDYFLNPIIASSFRIIRLFAVGFSILITPIYVATLTFHYELIPKDLMGTLITSRREVPLPPILEAIFLELTIELLREAGARLPTKVGQTIGIVGGIVIGTASVEAGLTSNVLLIIVALAALASFTTPVYQMGNTIRLLRFPFLLFANFYGMLGVVICFCYMLAHLLRLTSLGRPFLEPIYPTRMQDLKDAFFRFPFSANPNRPIKLQTGNSLRFNPKKAKEKKDVDE